MFQLNKFAERLRGLRNDKNVSQGEIAQLLGVSRTQVSDMENGKSGTTLERLVFLSEYYQVSTDYILGLKDTRK